MLDAVAHSNCLAVAVAAVAYYLLGAAWFTPLFGKAWDRSIGYDRSRDTTFGPAYYVGVILAALAPTFGEALIVGVVVGRGVAAVSINNALTPHTPHPYVFGAVTGGYHLVGIVLVSAIIGAFPN